MHKTLFFCRSLLEVANELIGLDALVTIGGDYTPLLFLIAVVALIYVLYRLLDYDWSEIDLHVLAIKNAYYTLPFALTALTIMRFIESDFVITALGCFDQEFIKTVNPHIENRKAVFAYAFPLIISVIMCLKPPSMRLMRKVRYVLYVYTVMCVTHGIMHCVIYYKTCPFQISASQKEYENAIYVFIIVPLVYSCVCYNVTRSIEELIALQAEDKTKRSGTRAQGGAQGKV